MSNQETTKQLFEVSENLLKLANQLDSQHSIIASRALFDAAMNVHQAIGALTWEDEYNG